MGGIWQMEFTDDFMTDVEVIDNAHKNLMMRANKLFDLSTSLDIKEPELIQYIEDGKKDLLGHFDEEISLFEKYNLVEAEEHKLKHQEVVNLIDDLESAPRPILVKALIMNQIILRYLADHLFTEDKKCIEIIKSRGKIDG